MNLNESHVEEAALDWLKELGYGIAHGPHIAPGEPAAERDSLSEVVQFRFARTLTRPLPRGEENREAIWGLNPAAPDDAREEALHGGVLHFHPDILN